MQVQDQTLLLTELMTSDEDCLIPLTEDEQDCIQGGWVGVALRAAALGATLYQSFTTEKERMEHRDFVGKVALEVAFPNPIARYGVKRLFA